MANAAAILTVMAAIAHLTFASDDCRDSTASTVAPDVGDKGPGLVTFPAYPTEAVRHKAAARALHDPIQGNGKSLRIVGNERLVALAIARFVGIALDYDGTIVPNEPDDARFGPPPQTVTDELVRLIDQGLQIGFATGRGQSAGQTLRAALPECLRQRVVMGYFNGSLLRTRDIDIHANPPGRHESVAEVAGWFDTSGLFKPDANLFVSHLQLTVVREEVIDPHRFAASLAG